MTAERGHAVGWVAASTERPTMITLGIILLIIGLLTGTGILWSIGVLLVLIGAILWILGAMGRAIGGRRHYW
ncbi:MAG TPA: DUF6131 family protein [Nitriliruptorales bacterium]|nr:DUF6131 family protein [Nitriliruptorales bacterium]